MPHPLLIFSQSDYLIQIVDINSHIEWQTVQIQISWLLQKPTDLDLHCLQQQGISVFSRTRVNSLHASNFACFFVVCGFFDFFFKFIFFKKIFQEYHQTSILLSNSLDPDQAGCFVGPDLGPNWLQRFAKVISKQQKSPLVGKELKHHAKFADNFLCFFIANKFWQLMLEKNEHTQKTEKCWCVQC